MTNKKNKIRNKRKRKNARNQYTCTKRTVISEQNNDTTATAGLSSPTVTQIPTETEDDISDLNQSASFQKLNTSVVNLMDIETNQDNFFFLMSFCILKSLINQICVCCSCNGDNLEIHNTEKKGFSLQVVLNVMTVTGHMNSFLPLNSNFKKKIPGAEVILNKHSISNLQNEK